MAAGDELADVAERFDALYTEMTLLQRELIAAARNGDGGQRERELKERAETVIAGVSAAHAALSVGAPGARAVEAAALRERLLRQPLDRHLLLAAVRSQTRRYALPLLADALELASGNDELDVFAGLPIADLLSAPRGIGAGTARSLATHLGFAPETTPAELGKDELERLVTGLRAAAVELPDEVQPWHRRGAAKPTPDGEGSARLVLDSWLRGIGAGEVRTAAAQAVARAGWPDDAVPVAEMLFEFTDTVLTPAIIEDWETLAPRDDPDARLSALRALRSEWWHAPEREWQGGALVLDFLIEAMTTVRKARRLLDGPTDAWGSSTPLALSRTCGLRCGRFTGVWDADAVVPLLAKLPG